MATDGGSLECSAAMLRLAPGDPPGDGSSFCLATPVQFGAGRRFYRLAWAELRHLSPGMNTLVMMGSSAAYFYSLAGPHSTADLSCRYRQPLLRSGRGHHHPDSSRQVPGSQGQGPHFGGHRQTHSAAAQDRQVIRAGRSAGNRCRPGHPGRSRPGAARRDGFPWTAPSPKAAVGSTRA